MKISTLEVQNFKYFDHLTINTQNKDVIILLGLNGIGKSCIFDAIYYASELSKYQGDNADKDYYSKDPDKKIEVKLIMEDGSIISRALPRRELENYLCDPLVLKEYCEIKKLSFNQKQLSNIDFITDNVKKNSAIMKAIGHQTDWRNFPLTELAKIIYQHRRGKFQTLYDSLTILLHRPFQ